MSLTPKILVLGGCRSGKSGHALQLAASLGAKRLFIATCVPRDKEMQMRVDCHRQDRDDTWETLEVPVDLVAAIRSQTPSTEVVLVDCLTLWLNNLLMENDDVEWIREQIAALAAAVQAAPFPIVLVSNEVGTGIVPENRLARQYRDLAGWTNQAMAAACDRVVWTVAGIPVPIKPSNSPGAP